MSGAISNFVVSIAPILPCNNCVVWCRYCFCAATIMLANADSIDHYKESSHFVLQHSVKRGQAIRPSVAMNVRASQ